MNKLNQILEEYAEPPGSLGRPEPLGPGARGKVRPTRSVVQERDKLIADLQTISRRNAQMAWVVVVALLVLFAAGLWLALFSADKITAKYVLGTLGVSAGGSVLWLKSLWSEKSATELLLRLAVSVEGKALEEVIKVLAKRALPVKGKNLWREVMAGRRTWRRSVREEGAARARPPSSN